MSGREVVRYPIEIRKVQVSAIATVAETVRIITLSGEQLKGFQSAGPADHVKVFFPDPATGILTAPVKTADGGIQRPQDAVSISRDYTPLRFTPGTETEPPSLDLEFILHPEPGPATAWAEKAKIGDELVVAGPRGSHLSPTEYSKALLIADETAFPAFTRWLELLPAETKIEAILQGNDESITEYLNENQTARARIEWIFRIDGPDQLVEAVRSAEIDSECYVWAAGEASELIPLRRYFKYELELDRQQYDVDGYWKRGITNLDHHAPLDETDPD